MIKMFDCLNSSVDEGQGDLLRLGGPATDLFLFLKMYLLLAVCI